jgi:malonyl-CoA O-methyltransferase
MFDLVVSASVLQWVSDLSAAIREMCRVVRPGGECSIAFFCHGSLGELQRCFRDVNADNSSKMSRLHRFWTVDDVKSVVSSIDFENVVITVETEIDWYDDLHSLLRSIKNIGAGTVSGGTGNGLGWRGVLQETSRRYQELYEQNGKIPATYNVLYLTARTATRRL